ncbi:oligosaccharide flippase family protein [Photobacterium leiognathi]|uniref:oligosaccharide flippase family protein n=1 Tax=Photobacterium leiognathi TaxID=553611 RepID=UPI0029816A23|nr:oligosaccharide flippase family protein [Photobacterium leiognathi]
MITSSLYKAMMSSMFSRLLTYIFQFLILVLYSRIFTPEQFGVVGSIQVFVIFFQLIADAGLGPAIINDRFFSKNKRDGIFSFTILLAIIISFLFFMFSFTLNYYYESSGYQYIGAIVSISVFFCTISIIPITCYNKDLKFLSLARIDIISQLFSLIVTLCFYYLNFGVYALASKVASYSFFRFILSYSGSSKTEIGRAKIGREIYHIKSILNFSLYQFGFDFINYFSRNLDNILIAKFIGPVPLGIYDRAYQLVRYPLQLTSFAMGNAIQPSLSKYGSDMKYIIREHNLLSKRLLFIAIPMSIFIYFNSKYIVDFVLGKQWQSVSPLISLFSISIPFQVVLSTSGAFFRVVNKPNLMFLAGCIGAIIFVVFITCSIFTKQVENVALAISLSFIFNSFSVYFILFKFAFNESAKDFIFDIFRTLIVSILPITFFIIITIKSPFNFNSSLYEILYSLSILIIPYALFYKRFKKYLSN